MPSPIEKIAAAACAVAFAVIALSGLLAYGDHAVRSLAIAAAVLGCVSQFLFQSPLGAVRILSVYAAAVGFLAAIAATVTFCLSN